MIKRGEVYWGWVNPTLHVRSVDERQANGTMLNVQVRMSLLLRTQLFIGVYENSGTVISEEAFDWLPGETMTKALARGLERARLLSISSTKITGKSPIV